MAVNIENDWLAVADRVLSPNYNDRPEGVEVSLLVIHNISLPPGEDGDGFIEHFFQNRLPIAEHEFFDSIKELQVSAHLLIERSGRVVQFVPLTKRAWHAGVSCHDGIENCNDFSIGIELEGTDCQPYTSEQYDRLVAITKEIQSKYPAIKTDRIVGHSDIAPGRKTDPGSAFNWDGYLDKLS